jgi:hypothetical protein
MKKQKGFAIRIDEPGKERLYLKRFVSSLENDYYFLKEEPRFSRLKKTGKGKYGDFIVFGISKHFDFTTVDKKEFAAEYGHFDVYSLMDEKKNITRLLKRYIRNSDRRYKYDGLKFPKKYKVVNDVFFDLNYLCEKPKKKKKKKKVKTYYVPQCCEKKYNTKKSNLKEVEIYCEYVRIGWKNYTIYEDAHGDEFIIRKGNLYWVNRDSYGPDYLSV